MTITNLTATESNGVVTAEFEAMGGRVKLQVGLDKVVDYYVSNQFDFSTMVLSHKDMEEIIDHCNSHVLKYLNHELTHFINHNLQEA